MLGGQPLDDELAVLWPPGCEVEYIAPAGVASLIVVVDEWFLDQLGWSLTDNIVHAVPCVRLDALANTCRLATLAASRLKTNTISDAATAATTVWRERVRLALEAALEPWLNPEAQRSDRRIQRTRRWLVKDACRWFDQQSVGRPISIDTCATALGISRRTLFRAFRGEMGMGPQGYLQLVRLHQLREQLLQTNPTETSITGLASELGFTHMGRLSAAYRRHFAEYPKQTLQRS